MRSAWLASRAHSVTAWPAGCRAELRASAQPQAPAPETIIFIAYQRIGIGGRRACGRHPGELLRGHRRSRARSLRLLLLIHALEVDLAPVHRGGARAGDHAGHIAAPVGGDDMP